MPYCTRCGGYVSQGDAFCTSCGLELPKGQAYAQAASTSGRTGSGARRVVVVIVLLMLVAGAAFIFLDPGGGPSGETMVVMTSSGQGPINSPTTPLTGQQLLSAYMANQTQADSTYANKSVYIQDTVDQIGVDPNTGEFISSVNLGTVVLFWSDQSQAVQVFHGDQILAECSIQGITDQSESGNTLLYLDDCTLISSSAAASTTTTSSFSVTAPNI